MSNLYVQNFDALTVGTGPPGWSAGVVRTYKPVSGAHSFGFATFGPGTIAVQTGFAATADLGILASQKAQLDGSGHGANHGFLVRCSADGQNGYYFLPDLFTGYVVIFNRVSGTFEALDSSPGPATFVDGDTAWMRCEVQGSTIRWKLWNGSGAEPGPWGKTWTDGAVTAPGYVGIYESYNNSSQGSTTAASDDHQVYNLVSSTAIPVTDVNWFWSPSNWLNGVAVNPGAYFKVGFTGTTASLTVDVSRMVTASVPAKQYPRIRYQVDGGPYTTRKLLATDVTISLASGLASGIHQLILYFLSSDAYTLRWNETMSLVVTGLVIGGGESSVGPSLRPGRLIAFGDSITEGAWCLGGTTDTTNYSDYEDATASYLAGVAEALNCEYGSCAFGGQSWDVSNGDIPALTDAWDFIYGSHSRLSGGLFSPIPDYLLNNMGANGGATAAMVTAWLGAVRAATGSTTKIFEIIPFGGSNRANITSGVQAYQVAHPGDPTYLIDLGSIPELTSVSGGATAGSFDGLHLDVPTHGRMGAMVARAIQVKLGGTATTTTPHPPAFLQTKGMRVDVSLTEV